MSLPRIVGEFGLVADPEIRFSDNGKSWATMRGVAKKRIRDAQGQWTDGDPLYINIACFGNTAENIVESALKGDRVMVEGVLEPNEWTDRDGVIHKDVRIVAEEVAVSVTFGAAKTKRMLESGGVTPAAAPAGGGLTEPPF
jgi:single-strand DNA-binding protein